MRVTLKSMPSGARLAAKLTTAVLVSGALAACNMQHTSTHEASYRPIQPHERFPIEVTQSTVKLEVPVHRGATGLTRDVRNDVRDIIFQFQSSGADRLIVVQHPSPRHPSAAAAAMSEIHGMVVAAGLSSGQVMYSRYPRGYAGRGAPILISFDNHVAMAPECGDWSENMAATYENVPYPNFGCSAQSNLAAMVADPRDLVQPRGMTPPHAGRRDVVLGNYRLGAKTEADTSGADEGSVSEVGQDD